MLDHALSAQQLAVICALSSGVNMTTAAEQAGVHRNTITNWRRNLLPFQHALADAQYDCALYYREKVEELMDLAIQSLRDILTNPNASPSIKLRATLLIINTACTPPAPKKQVELVIEKVLVQDSPSAPNIAQPPADSVPPELHEDAQSPIESHQPASPSSAAPPKICAHSRPFAANSSRNIARNAKCPCGSGRKYKRCCLDASQTETLATAA